MVSYCEGRLLVGRRSTDYGRERGVGLQRGQRRISDLRSTDKRSINELRALNSTIGADMTSFEITSEHGAQLPGLPSS